MAYLVPDLLIRPIFFSPRCKLTPIGRPQFVNNIPQNNPHLIIDFNNIYDILNIIKDDMKGELIWK